MNAESPGQRSTQRIVPMLWFDDQAEDAARFYTSLFSNGSIGPITRYSGEGVEIHGQLEGTVMTVDFELAGYRMTCLNGGPHFRFTPAMSLFVVCESENEIDERWQTLAGGGTVMMSLDRHEWAEKYGWVKDRYGLSWQLCLGRVEDVGQKITPSLLFVGDQAGRAEEAATFYTSIVPDSAISDIFHYGPDENQPEGTVKHARFELGGEHFMAMDNGLKHNFQFNEAVSLSVQCDAQDEIDYYWDLLTSGGDPGAQQCGWLKDKFGVSWQVSPTILREMLRDADSEAVGRVTRALLQMKKIDIQSLKDAYRAQMEG